MTAIASICPKRDTSVVTLQFIINRNDSSYFVKIGTRPRFDASACVAIGGGGGAIIAIRFALGTGDDDGRFIALNSNYNGPIFTKKCNYLDFRTKLVVALVVLVTSTVNTKICIE